VAKATGYADSENPALQRVRPVTTRSMTSRTTLDDRRLSLAAASERL